jgi:hypothetical protein
MSSTRRNITARAGKLRASIEACQKLGAGGVSQPGMMVALGVARDRPAIEGLILRQRLKGQRDATASSLKRFAPSQL